MTKVELQTLVQYWLTTSDSDWKAYLSLRRSRQYAQALFFLHLVIEKRIKALIVKETRDHAPFSHALPFLIGKVAAIPSEQMLGDLLVITGFNISGRYPDEKLEFYSNATKAFADEWHRRGKEILAWLDEKLSQ